MIANNSSDYRVFDSLILQDQSFSVFRLPGSETMTFVMQREGTPEYLHHLSALNGKEGFVVAPFEIADHTPVVLLHPDLTLEGETIFQVLTNEVPSLQKYDNLRTKPNDNQSDTFESYKKAFEQFQSSLRSDSCKKIVLSRTLNKPKPKNFSAGKTFMAACDAYPEAFVYLCHTPKTGTWLGSSPELILSGEKTNWQTVALAGTMKVSTDPEQVNWNEKNIREQRIVADYLGEKIESQHLTYVKSGPFNARAGRLIHLKTEFRFQMNNSNKIGDLLDSLHPTPAVCGFPKEEAYRLIIEHEGYKRTYYSGFIGQLSTKGKTDLFVNLRCMQIKSGMLTFYAGGGLLPYSELESEWEETEEKMQTMLAMIDF